MHRISCTIPAFILSIAISLCSYNVVSIAREEAVTYEPAEDVALDLDSRDDENEESGDENLDLYNDDDFDELQSLLEQNPNDKLHIDDSFLEEELIEQYDLVEEENQPYHPMGLQTSWSREDELAQALMSGRLVLAIITAPWCDKGNELIQQASHAADLLDDFFASDDESSMNHILGNLSLDETTRLSKPLIGIIDSETAPQILLESLGGATSYPALKFILTFPTVDKISGEEGDSQEQDENTMMWDYIGPRESSYDLYESVMMYWYRFVVSNALEGHRKHATADISRSPIFAFESFHQLKYFIQKHEQGLLRPAHARLRHQMNNTLLSEVFDFFMGGRHREFSGVLHNFKSEGIEQNQQCMNTQQNNADCKQTTETTQEIDPYILLIQCRSPELGDESAWKAKLQFDELAEEMTHRRDVAFFSLNDEFVCRQWLAGTEVGTNGAVVVFRIRRFVSYSSSYDGDEANVTRSVRWIKTKWEEALQNQPHSIYDPTRDIGDDSPINKKIQMNIVNDPMDASEYVQSKLVPFVITQTTPTILWFDRHRAAQLAFPWYRKVHAVLVVDIGLSYQHMQTSSQQQYQPNTFDSTDIITNPQWPPKLNRSQMASQLLRDQQRAMQLFYITALRHRTKHPKEDVVFLVVPSSETRILTKFGIDIWTNLDKSLFPSKTSMDGQKAKSANDTGYCSSGMPKRGNLPVMIITDSSTRSGKQSSRYYLCSGNLIAPSPTLLEDGGPVDEFLESFFDGTNDKPFIRSETTPNANSYSASLQSNKNQANVTVLTGNSFQSLIMERTESHSMLLVQTITCGHCKRFSVLWNEFSRLVQAMNWGDVIEVMKIDVSKNDVPHDKIDVWDVPSVYYFPAGEKDNPIEVTWIGPQTNPQHDYDEGLSWIRNGADLIEWIIRQGKLDIELLLSLDESKNKPS